MATLAELRARAKRLGITASVIRGASTVKELQSVIADYDEDEKPAKKTPAKKAAQAPVRRGRPPGSKNKPKAEEAPKRRGRPPGSGVKKSATGTKAPAKRTTAKRPSTARRTPAKVANDAGRFMLESIDYTETEGWNPRPGSAPDRIVKALRKFRGNREKVYDFLLDDLWDFVTKTKQDGTRRTKAEALKMLQYRIARTDWEFAVRTGQHQPSENRAEYGSQTDPKPKPKATARKAAPAKAPARRGRPPKAQKAPVEAPKRRGRPPGSKNKPKVAAKAPAARRTATPKRTTAVRRTRR